MNAPHLHIAADHRQPLHDALIRAEQARHAMNSMCAAGKQLPDEHTFGAVEDEWFAAEEGLRAAVHNALGVSAARIAAALA